MTTYLLFHNIYKSYSFKEMIPLTVLKTFIQTHQTMSFILLLGYLIFLSCFSFPLRWPVQFEIIYTFIMGYVLLAMLSACLINHSLLKVYSLTLGCTAIGIFLRYLLEYGEYSNTLNMTPFNLMTYLVLVPLFFTFMHCLIGISIQTPKK